MAMDAMNLIAPARSGVLSTGTRSLLVDYWITPDHHLINPAKKLQGVDPWQRVQGSDSNTRSSSSDKSSQEIARCGSLAKGTMQRQHLQGVWCYRLTLGLPLPQAEPFPNLSKMCKELQAWKSVFSG